MANNNIHGKQIISQGIHAPISYSFADAAARLAATAFSAEDIYKIAIQLDNNTLWILLSLSPVVWSKMNHGSSSFGSLDQVLTNGNTTDGYDIVVVAGDVITITDDPINPTDGTNKGYVDGYVFTYAILADGTRVFTGDQSLGNHKLTNVATPTLSQDAATKAYVDSAASGGGTLHSVLVNGNTTDGYDIVVVTGDVITLIDDPVNPTDGTNKGYVDGYGDLFIKKDGSVVFTADQSMGSHKLTNVTNPSAAQDAATKNYVDGYIGTQDLLYIRKDGTIPFTGDQSLGNHKLTNVTDPASAQDAATKIYVDGYVTAHVITDHGALSGLADDDHTQYILVNGTRAFTGDQSLGNHKLTNVTDPASAQDAATKNYVDGYIGSNNALFIRKDGSVAFTADQSLGNHKLTNVTDPAAAQDATTKAYVDGYIGSNNALFIRKDGSVAFTADQSMGSHKLTNVTNPTNPQDAATKAYVDTASGGATLHSILGNGNTTDGYDIIVVTGDVITITDAPVAPTDGVNKAYIDGYVLSGEVSGPVGSTTIGTHVVDFDNIIQATAASKLIGRRSGSAGNFEEISLGSNLSMSGTTLNATGGGGGASQTLNQTLALGNSTDGYDIVISTGDVITIIDAPTAPTDAVNKAYVDGYNYGGISVGGDLTGTIANAQIAAGAIVNNDINAAAAIVKSKLENSAGLSVIGRSANSTGAVADITASATGQVLRYSGTTLAFGAVDLADTDAVTGLLPAGNQAAQDHGGLTGLADDDHTQYILVNGTRAFTGDQSLGSHKLTNVTNPTAAQDAATKAYVDGYNFTAAITLTGDVNGPASSNTLRDSAALSVIGRSSNSSGHPADITAGTDGYVLRRSGTTLDFGKVDLANSNSVTGILAIGNGGTGLATAGATANRALITLNGTTFVTGQIDLSTSIITSLLPLANLTGGSAVGQVLRNTGGNVPAWGAVDLADTDAVTGVLPTGNQAAQDHGGLTGLADDDHTQYILVNGTRAFTGDQSMGSHKLTNVTDPASAQDAATKNYVDGYGDLFIKKDGSVVFTANQSMGSHKLTNVTDPTSAQDAATKAYVDAQVATTDTLKEVLSHGNVTDGYDIVVSAGDVITITDAPVVATDGANKGYVDGYGDLFIKKDGSVVFTADQSMGSHKLTNVTNPSNPQDAATKAYVDGAVTGGGTLKTILASGNVTDGYDIVVSAGDVITITDAPVAPTDGVNKGYVDGYIGSNNALFIRKDGSVAFTADQSMGSHKLTNVTDPGSAQDAATKNYVDTTAVLVGASAGGDLAGTYPNPTVTKLTISSQAQGDVLYYDGSNWVRLAANNDGYVLTTHGSGQNPTWTMAIGSVTQLLLGNNLTDANDTITISGGARRKLPAATLSTNRTLTINTTSMVTGEVIQIERFDLTANTYAVINGGTSGGTIYTFPSDGVARGASFIYDGVNIVFASVGRIQ